MRVDPFEPLTAHQIDPNARDEERRLSPEQAARTYGSTDVLERHEVAMMTLDRWAREEGVERADLIKIDVEGFETEVLLGAKDFIARNAEIILIVEFAVYAQLDAECFNKRPPNDLALFQALKDMFKEIYLIARAGGLVKIETYAQLRALMICGFPVDDLLCCQALPEELRPDLISLTEFSST